MGYLKNKWINKQNENLVHIFSLMSLIVLKLLSPKQTTNFFDSKKAKLPFHRLPFKETGFPESEKYFRRKCKEYALIFLVTTTNLL